MNLAVYSDLHVEFGVFLPHRNLNADVVVLAGDILAGGCRVMRWARRKDIFADRPVIFVAGNHEFYGERYEHQRRRMREEAARWGVSYLQQDAVVICGVRFLGCTLWTDFELNLSAEVGHAGTGGSAALFDGPRREQALAGPRWW
jgi:hypothetical protein